ncbi:MAG: hypothetical protein K0R29_75 [Pseudobdellovibrio sp.]|nr:hypothetical protein [Pseudobdellovibrio sp.]
MQQTLRLQDYEVSLHLGCSAEEQKYLQPVRFNLEIDFAEAVQGAVTDKLEHAIDYSKLAETIKNVSKAKPYHLIEHLNLQVFESLTKYLRSQSVKGKVTLSVRKLQVPIENLKNGAVFICSEQL